MGRTYLIFADPKVKVTVGDCLMEAADQDWDTICSIAKYGLKSFTRKVKAKDNFRVQGQGLQIRGKDKDQGLGSGTQGKGHGKLTTRPSPYVASRTFAAKYRSDPIVSNLQHS